MGLHGVFLTAKMFLGRRRVVAVLAVTIMLLASIPYMAGAVSRIGSAIMVETFLDQSRPHMALHLWFPGTVESEVLGGAWSSVSTVLEDLGFKASSRVYVVEAGLLAVEAGTSPSQPGLPEAGAPGVAGETLVVGGRVFTLAPVYLVIAPEDLEPKALGLGSGVVLPSSPPAGGPVEVLAAMVNPASASLAERGFFEVLGVQYRIIGSAAPAAGIVGFSIVSYVMGEEGFGYSMAWGYALFLYTTSPDPEALALWIASRYGEAVSQGGLAMGDILEELESSPPGEPVILPPRPVINALDGGWASKAVGGLVSMVVLADYKAEELASYIFRGDIEALINNVRARLGQALFEDAGACLIGVEVIGQDIRIGGSYSACSPIEDGARYTALAHAALYAPPVEGGLFLLSNIAALAAVSAILVALLVSALQAGTAVVEWLLGDMRPWLAMLIARGGGNTPRAGLALAVLIVAGFSILIGGIVSSAAIPLLTSLMLDYPGVVEGRELLVSRGLWIASGSVALLGVGAALVSRLGRLGEISPVEAVRRVEALERGHKGRGRRAVTVFVALSIVSVLLGLHGDPEGVLEWFFDMVGEMVAIPIAFIIFVAFFLSPLAPAILLSFASSTLAGGSKPYILLARISSRLMPEEVSGFTVSSALRMKERMAASSRVVTMAFAALASFTIADGFAVSLEETLAGLSGRPYDIVSLIAASRAMAAASLLAAAAASVVYLATAYAGVAGTIEVLEREAVVLRARGASRGVVLAFIYGSLLPLMLYSAAAGLAAGVIGGLSILATFKAASMTVSPDIPGEIGLPLPTPTAQAMALLILPLAAALLLPAATSAATAREADIARALRS
ncbi:hypothetical protein [Aeropyrum pernix]|uniref:hypothetical protein n=1 Tax=Aeropyrum pernix TaxID=56636 RepID=UPI0011E4E71D|nr:hypothetical protein [Aeropyrum pernix]